MYKGKTIAVVVPAYNVDHLIGQVIETMPNFVDRIFIIDDCSQDQTYERVASYKEIPKFLDRLELTLHPTNQGVGGAIITGYKRVVEEGIDIAVVMAGDAQMDPLDLEAVITPVVNDKADYAKGNRLFSGEAWRVIPKIRYLGNSLLSLFTKIASGYWHIADSQTGYTAISCDALKRIPFMKLYRRYGFPNHMLVMLNVFDCSVVDVSIRPVYNIGEKSGIRLWKVIPTISWLLMRLFFWRLKEKYIIRDFHPLVFFYGMALFLLTACIPLFTRMVYLWIDTGRIPPINALALMFASIMSMQSLFFAMWFDMEHNRNLR
jgi:glycosyltransferase involved in cell wall biosynthesis